MGVESDADRASFVDPDEHAVCVTGPFGTFDAIFEDEYQLSDLVESTAPMLLSPTSVAEAAGVLRKGSLVTVSGVTYRVRRHEPDGTGMSRLILES